MSVIEPGRPPELAPAREDPALLREIAQRVLWLGTAIVDSAIRRRPNHTGVKVGGHQASSASMVDIMVSLWFSELTHLYRVSVKPHASPLLHATTHLLGELEEKYLPTLRTMGGLQSYPSRPKDPGVVDFSGSPSSGSPARWMLLMLVTASTAAILNAALTLVGR